MGELRKCTKFIDERDNLKRLATDSRISKKQLSLELCNWILSPNNWKPILLLESIQIPFLRNKAFLSSMYPYIIIIYTNIDTNI